MTTNEILYNPAFKVRHIGMDGLVYLEYHGDKIVAKDYVGTKSNDKEFLFVKDTNVKGLYTYGLEQLEDTYDHKAGYVWSSRDGVINEAFDMALMKVVIDNSAQYSMDAYYLKPLVEEYFGKKLTVREYVEHNSDGTKETIFKFQEVE